MTCILSNGTTLGCKSAGGSQKLYLGTYSGSTEWEVDGSGIVSGVTGYCEFFEFEMPEEQIEGTSPGEYNKENNTANYSHTINARIYGIDQTSIDTIKILGQGRVFGIIKDNNDNYFLFGKNNGLHLTVGNITLGKAFADLNGADITLVGKDKYPITEVNAAVLTTLGF